MSVPVSTDWKVPHIEYVDELSATKLQRMSANMSKAHGAASLRQEVRRLRRVGNLRYRRATPATIVLYPGDLCCQDVGPPSAFDLGAEGGGPEEQMNAAGVEQAPSRSAVFRGRDFGGRKPSCDNGNRLAKWFNLELRLLPPPHSKQSARVMKVIMVIFTSHHANPRRQQPPDTDLISFPPACLSSSSAL